SVAGDNNVFGPMVPPPGVVTINGVTLPFVNNTGAPPGITAGPSTLTGTFTVGPVSGTHKTPEGYLVGPNASAYPNGLSANDVNTVVMSAVDTANRTRAAIRLPLGSRARMMISVSDLDGNLLAIYRMHDATIFSIDVSVAKARNVIYFSSTAGQLPGVYADNNPGSIDLPGVPAGTAVTNRTISFGAQPMYRNGVMVGGLGVSGDGVDQDDFVTAGGGSEMILNDSSDPSQTGFGFEAPAQIRADQIVIRNVRLPYIKFPRNPTQ